MASAPTFATTPAIGSAVINTANTNRDGSGSITSVLAAGSNGTRIDRVTVQATGNTSAGMVRLFIHDGTNARLYREIPVTAITPSGSAEAFAAELDDMRLVLPSGHSLRAATHNAESFTVIAEGASY